MNTQKEKSLQEKADALQSEIQIMDACVTSMFFRNFDGSDDANEIMHHDVVRGIEQQWERLKEVHDELSVAIQHHPEDRLCIEIKVMESCVNGIANREINTDRNELTREETEGIFWQWSRLKNAIELFRESARRGKKTDHQN